MGNAPSRGDKVSDVVILIPAAGASTRMRGADKLLEPVAGIAQLARVVARCLETGCDVIVTLPAPDSPRAAVLPTRSRLRVISVPDAGSGMSSSLRAGVAQSGNALGLMIVPADMPDLETDDFQSVIANFSTNPDCPARAISETGTPGHPVILPRRLFAAIHTLTGDQGARHLLEGEKITEVPLAGNRALTDLDTPEDWMAWRARHE